MAKRVVISNSDVRSFKRCRRKWDYLSPLRRNLKTKKVVARLSFGRGIHVALSDYYALLNENKHILQVLLNSFEKWYKKEILRLEELGVLEEQEEELLELYELGKSMLTSYQPWAAIEDSKSFTKVLYNEKRIEIPLLDYNGKRTCGRYSFKADLIVEDSDGFYWLVDHKTIATANIPSLELDEQAVSYLYGTQRKFGIKLEGFIFNFLLKKIPAVPQVLKNGELSKKKLTTTYEVFRDTIEKHYETEGKTEIERDEIFAPFVEILDELQGQANPFFTRIKVYKSQAEIQEIGNRLYDEYLEMRNPKIKIYPNPTRDCIWDCPLRTLCIVENDAGDLKSLIEDTFETKEEDNALIIIPEDYEEEV